jgi:hypothetical protein
MFNLEKAVASWRRQMMKAGIKNAQIMDELEAHLREEVEHQLAEGTDPEVAFDKATLKMGAPKPLQREFKKCRGVQSDRRRFYQALYILSALIFILINGWTMIALELTGMERIELLSVVVSVCFYLVAMPLLPRLLWPVYARLVRLIKYVTCILALWPIVALLSVFHVFSFELGNMTVMAIWSVYAGIMIGALAGAFHRDARGDSDAGGFLPPFASVPFPIRPLPPAPPRSNAVRREPVEA